MIKSLVRWGMTFSVAGAAFLSWGLVENLKAIALPKEEILEKLNSVPVFAITDAQGMPLVSASEDNKEVATLVFISDKEANQVIEQLKTEKPELAQNVKVELSTLGRIYELGEVAKTKENAVSFFYIPEAEAVNDAKTVTEGEERTYKGGVPLFIATGGENKAPLSMKQDSEDVIPFFFDKQQLEIELGEFKKQQPDIAESVEIDVIILEDVIETLKTSEDKGLPEIVLIPSAESLQAAQSLQGNSPELQSPEAAPGAAPEAAPEAAPAE